MHRRSMTTLLCAAACCAAPSAAIGQIEFVADQRWIYASYQITEFDPDSGFPIDEQFDADRLNAWEGWRFEPFDESVSLSYAPEPGQLWAVDVAQDSHYTAQGLFGSGSVVIEEGAANPPCDDFYLSRVDSTNRVVTWFTVVEPCRIRVEVSFDAPAGFEISAEVDPALAVLDEPFKETLVGGAPVTVSREIWMPYADFDYDWRVSFQNEIECRQGERFEVSFDTSMEVLPDCNAADFAEPHGVHDLADVQDFIGFFAAGAPEADLAEPLGVFDLGDLGSFVESFNAGCP